MEFINLIDTVHVSTSNIEGYCRSQLGKLCLQETTKTRNLLITCFCETCTPTSPGNGAGVPWSRHGEET